MSKGIVLVSSLVGLFSVCVGQVIFPDPQPGVPVVIPGQCDVNIAAVPNFSMNDFQGTWHTIAGYPEANQDGQCISQVFTVNDTNSMHLDSFSVLDLTQSTTDGHITFASDGDLSGKLIINFWVNGEAQSIPYWILSTDYTDYALVYSCVNIDGQNRGVWSWKLSRTRQQSDAGNAAINTAIAGVDVLRNDYYENIQQTDTACFYLPDIAPGTNIVLPGQCDSSIGGMPNFNISRYAGEWRLIEAYYSRYYSGACNVARYTLQDSDTISITNSQVVNEQLGSISGTATISSTDGSGQLTFNIINRLYVQYILDTDYDSYALAYGCANSGDNQRRITSWKFSRSNTLSQDATNRINQVINDIEFLHQPYYYQVDRSSDGCFYFPTPQPGVPVVFRGQCDENIAAVPNFNMNDFQGTWYTIAGYPEANQDGQCISQEFTVNATNSMHLDSFSVLDLTQSTTEGHVTFASDDDLSGKLKINIWLNGEAQSIPYWILSTDYTDYALAYSCVNIDEENRGVWSWQLSRNRQLSDEGTAAINDAIAEVDVLRNDYYEDIQQTDTACFYLPDIAPGTNIVLPGQCDSSIRGMPNFDISRYAGEWRLIEAYYSRYYSGACNVARYTLQDSDTINITNSQVVNEELRSISGTATISSTDGSGQLTFNIINRLYVQYILDTDYDSYALAYGCANSGDNQRRITSWKFSRSDTLSQDATNRINQIINDIEFLHQPYYYQVDRSSDGCFYYPELQLGEPVVLPGQCDENIAAVPNFNMNDFQGTWYEIAGYPEANKDGQCISKEFTVNATNSMHLDSFSVLDLNQSTTEGHVTFASDDDLSGKLEINIWVNGEAQSIPYWILSTDYTSYALAYSCVNIDEEYRAVGSWKLSRNVELSEDANSVINDVISTTQGLNQEYYQDTSQTDQACFHYPTQTGDRVIIPGQCDINIPAVESFDVARFAVNSWYLIERYDAVGDSSCIGTRLSFDEQTRNIEVLSFEVVDENLLTIEGSGQLNSSDGSGIFSVVMGDSGDGERTETTIYILATDYDGYALAYSCENINSNQRQVGAWQLSRGRTMSEAGNAAIADIIEERPEFYEPYFKPISQADECLEPSSAFLFKSSIILIFVCTVVQLVW